MKRAARGGRGSSGTLRLIGADLTHGLQSRLSNSQPRSGNLTACARHHAATCAMARMTPLRLAAHLLARTHTHASAAYGRSIRSANKTEQKKKPSILEVNNVPQILQLLEAGASENPARIRRNWSSGDGTACLLTQISSAFLESKTIRIQFHTSLLPLLLARRLALPFRTIVPPYRFSTSHFCFIFRIRSPAQRAVLHCYAIPVLQKKKKRRTFPQVLATPFPGHPSPTERGEGFAEESANSARTEQIKMGAVVHLPMHLAPVKPHSTCSVVRCGIQAGTDTHKHTEPLRLVFARLRSPPCPGDASNPS